MYTDLHRPQPLHQLLLGWLPWPSRKPSTRVVAVSLEPVDVAERMKAGTVQQLVTSLRMQGIAGEDDHMLSSLESLVIAGEIEFSDFIGRIQNLFPRAIEDLDVSMRMKIASLMI
jgi:hypothetical protein